MLVYVSPFLPSDFHKNSDCGDRLRINQFTAESFSVPVWLSPRGTAVHIPADDVPSVLQLSRTSLARYTPTQRAMSPWGIKRGDLMTPGARPGQ